MLENFPYVATILSGVLAFLLGWVWYHPKVLGKRWVEARGKTIDDIHRAPVPYAVSLVLWLLAAFFYTFMLDVLKLDYPDSLNMIPDYFAGLVCVSSLLWVAFAMPPTVMGAFYTGYPFNAVAIDSAYQLAGYYAFAVVHVLVAMAL